MSGPAEHTSHPKQHEKLNDAALALVRERDWAVFPLGEQGKLPWKGSHGHKDATKDLEQITAWWSARPESNIGVATGAASGFVAIDLDGPEGQASWAKLCEGHDVPNTLTSQTGRDEGGNHLLFTLPRGVTIGNSAGVLGPHLDVRGDGGYIVVAPSIHPSGNAYAFVDPTTPVAPLPNWLLAKLTGKKEPPASSTDEQTTGGDWLAELKRKGIPKNTRDNTMTRVVGKFVRDGLLMDASVDVLRAIALDFNAKYCQPPLGEDDVADMVTRLYEKERARQRPNMTKKSFQLLDSAGLDALPDPAFLLDGYLVEDTVAALYGASGDGKSFVMLDIALSIASGKPKWFDHPIARAGTVLYVAAEGARGIKKRRRAWEIHNNESVPTPNFYVLPEAVQLLERGQLDAFVTAVREQVPSDALPVALVVLDTLSWCMAGRDENRQEEMSAFIAAAKRLQVEFPGAVVVIVHHVNRLGEMRGSIVLLNNVDTLLKTAREKDDRRVRTLEIAKQKDFDDQLPAFYYTLHPVPEVDSLVVMEVDAPKRTSQHEPSAVALKCYELLCGYDRTYNEWFRASGLTSKGTFGKAVKELEAANLIERTLDEGTKGVVYRALTKEGGHADASF